MFGKNTRIMALMGPTAVGKTTVAIEMARAFGGEVVGADSMQVYRHMIIGAASPTDEELAAAPHHLVGIIDPDEPFSVADWLDRATAAIRDIASRGKLPIVAGGTGLYFRALFEGLFEAPDPDPALRRSLKERAKSENLYSELRRVDPDAAANIHPNDLYRTVRALEIYRQTGKTISGHWRDQRPPEGVESLRIGLEADRRELHRRINERAKKMIETGLVEEVRGLKRMGYGRELRPMGHFGYRYIWAHVEDEMELDEAVELLARDTRRYARRQLTWFRGVDGIEWFNPLVDGELNRIMDRVGKWLGE